MSKMKAPNNGIYSDDLLVLRIVESFLFRGIYNTQDEVIKAALKALVKEQLNKEAELMEDL